VRDLVVDGAHVLVLKSLLAWYLIGQRALLTRLRLLLTDPALVDVHRVWVQVLVSVHNLKMKRLKIKNVKLQTLQFQIENKEEIL
jgi:hypothetical protein